MRRPWWCGIDTIPILCILTIVMEYGIQFFPDVRPEDKSPAAYFRDCLELVEMAEPLGYTHIRIVEHYFHYYGGYSPNPLLFLAAGAPRTKNARFVTRGGK